MCVFFFLLCMFDLSILFFLCFFFFQAEDGIRDLVRSRGLGDVYKRQYLSVPIAKYGPGLRTDWDIMELPPGVPPIVE